MYEWFGYLIHPKHVAYIGPVRQHFDKDERSTGKFTYTVGINNVDLTSVADTKEAIAAHRQKLQMAVQKFGM